MAHTPNVLRIAVSSLLGGLASGGGSLSERLQRSLCGTAQVVKSGARYVVVESGTAEDAQLARSVLRFLSGTFQFPDLWVFPWLGRRSLVIIPYGGGWGIFAFLMLSLLPLRLAREIWPSQVFAAVSAVTIVVGAGVGIHFGLRRQRCQMLLAEGQRRLRGETEQLERTRDEIRRHIATWEFLRDAETKFRNTSEFAEVYSLLGSFLSRLIPEYDGLSVFRLDESGAFLELEYADGRYSDNLRHMPPHRADTGMSGHALKTRSPYVAVDLSRDPYVLHPPGLTMPSVSGMALPLVTFEATVGVAVITRDITGPFPDYQVWAVGLLAGMVALRVNVLRARAREQRLVKEFTRLHDLVVRRSSVAGTANLLEDFVSNLRAAAEADAAVVYRVAAGRDLVDGFYQARSSELITRLRMMAPHETPARLAIDVGEVVEVSGPEPVDWPELAGFFAKTRVKRCLSVPLPRGDGEVVAVAVLMYTNLSAVPLGPDVLALCETHARYAGVAIHNYELYNTVVQQSHELRELLGRLVEVEEAERRRIALDLHDWLVQGLAVPAYRIQAAERLLEHSPAEARAELMGLVDQLNRAGEELRRIIRGLRPYLLEELGLTEAIRSYAQEFSRTHNIQCTVVASPNVGPEGGSQAALVAFRIIQEALNNVAKHAQATDVRIGISGVGDAWRIEVADNGCGLQTTGSISAGHYGLAGMRERALLVGGSVCVAPLTEGGTLVRIEIPGRSH